MDYHLRGEQSGETIELKEVSANPTQPIAASGRWKLVFKSDGLYIMDDAGNVTKIGSALEALVFMARTAIPAGLVGGDLAGAFPSPTVVWDRDQNILANQIFGS